MKYFISFSLILSSQLYAKPSSTIDDYHQIVSNQVLYWSEYLDKSISRWFVSDDAQGTCVASSSFDTPKESEAIDSFFQNNKYLNETEDIFVRLRFNQYFYSRESNKMNLRLNAQLPFDECKKQWKLYFQDSSNQNREVKTTDTNSGGVGIRYFTKEKFGIKSSYALGLSGGYPYLQARYKMPIKIESWKIEPVQLFKYSSKYHFEEETNIYFDKYVHQKDLFRVQLHRRTASTLKGTDYGLTLQYYWNLGKDAGLELTQSFFGNTAYNDFYSFDKNYKGVNNYVTSVSWRESVWRKWFYYEVKPSVNFHKDHNFEPSYSLKFLIDIYFGEYN